jgi:hypothetical protein
MKNLIIILSFVLFLFSCEKETETIYITNTDSIIKIDTIKLIVPQNFTSYIFINTTYLEVNITTFNQSQQNSTQQILFSKDSSNVIITTDSIIYLTYYIKYDSIHTLKPFKLIKNKFNKITF